MESEVETSLPGTACREIGKVQIGDEAGLRVLE